MPKERPGHRPASLKALLAEADRARPNDRIRVRDAIAEHGVAAVEAMDEWLRDGRHPMFAVQVIAAAGQRGAQRAAVAVLSRARSDSPKYTGDLIEQALAKLGAAKAAAPRPVDPHAPHSVPPDAGSQWNGFQEHEFGRIERTSWRGRDDPRSLAPLITRELRYQYASFESHGISRSPIIHFAVPERYRQFGEHESGFRAAKVVVYAHGPTDEAPDAPAEVVAGLYIEKGDGDVGAAANARRFGPVDDSWDWPWFLRALANDHVRQELAAAMTRHDLRIGDYTGQGWAHENYVGFAGHMEAGELVLRRTADGRKLGGGWDALVRRLESLPADVWHNLHVWRAWPKDEAITAGRAFLTASLMPVLSDLARIYIDIVREAIGAVSRGYQIVERPRTKRGRGISYRIQAHNRAGHFNVPREVMDELGIPTDGTVHVLVESPSARFEGTTQIRSGSEIYYRANDESTHGLQRITADDPLTVTVWKA